MTARNRVEVLHGVNFDVLERRDPEIYGGLSLTELENRIKHWARELELEARFFQTNNEGEFVELALTGMPAVEVHLSDVESRDDWRRVSVFEGNVLKKVSGKGPEGYREALEIIAKELGAG
jgi:3-dehydroquinate dehydratase-2